MKLPKYDGLIEKWKVDLITSRARRAGFKDGEIPDILQEMVLVLLDFRYEPSLSNGSTERVVLTSVIKNYLRKRKRTYGRYCANVERFGHSVNGFSHEEVDLRAMAISELIATLSPVEQQVCRGLAQGKSVTELAEEMSCNWGVVKRIIIGLRSRFENHSFEEWLEQ